MIKGLELSESWEKISLNHVIETLESGSRPKGGIKEIKGGVPSLGGEHLNSLGGFNFEKFKFIPRDFYNSLKKGILKKGDILVVKDGATTGKVSFVEDAFPYEEAAVNEHIFIIRGNKEIVNQKYLFYHLFSNMGQRQIKANFQGSAVGGINSKFVKNYYMILPPLLIQKKIVTILDQSQELKNLRRSTDKIVNEFLKSTFNTLFGDPINNPYDFPVGKIKDLVVKTQYGTSKKANENRKGIVILRMNNITYEGNWDLSEIKHIELDDKDKERFMVEKGELLFNRTNSKELVGKCAVYREDKPLAFAGYLIKLITDCPENSEYIAAHLNSAYGKAYLFNMAKSIVGMANINAKEVQQIPILIPPLELRLKYAEIVEQVEKIRKTQIQSRKDIDELDSILIHKLLEVN